MSFSHKTRVGVLRGGPSPEYEVSLNTGQAILANLPEEFEPMDIFISKEGAWHTRGLEKGPYQILKMVDVVINAMHGAYGEDGTVQKILEHFNVPYTGSGPLSSALGMNKLLSKNIFQKAGLKTPQCIVVEKSDNEEGVTGTMVEYINGSLPFPIIIKPANTGSSLGVSFVGRAGQTGDALKKSFEYSPKVLAEEFVDGREVTCGVIEGFRSAPIYSLLPVEVVKAGGRSLHDCDSKYKVPGNFAEEENKKIQETAVFIHQLLGLRHYSRSDFILHPKRGLFVLETDTLPELSHRSSFIKSLEAVGGNIKEFLSHLLSKALEKN